MLRTFKSILGQYALPALLYLLLTLGFTYPAMLHMGDAITGEHRGDTLQNYWNLWWTGKAVLELHQNPFDASFLHYPFGLGLYFHTYNVMNGIISLPVQLCCGTTVAANMMNMFAVVMSGLGMYALAWYLLGRSGDAGQSVAARQWVRRWSAFLAGVIYAFSPYMAFHLKVGQPFMMSLEWFPLYLLMLLKGLRERPGQGLNLRALLLAALFLVMIGLTDWHYTIYALLLTVLVALYEAARLRQWRNVVRITQSVALVGVLFALVMLPVLVPMLLDLAQGNNAVRDLRHSIYHSTDLMAFFFPSIYHPLWGEWASDVFHGRLVETFITGGVATLGYLPFALALCGAFGERRYSRLFVLVFVTFFVLALGPYLRVNGYNSYESDYPIPLPYLLFRQLPFMNIHRIPSRFVAVVMLALAVLAALGTQWLLQRPAVARLAVWQQRGLLALLVLLILFEFWPRQFGMIPTGAEQVSPFYQQLAAETDSFALMEVPEFDYQSMFYQTHHARPMMGGNISRPQGHPWRRARLLGPLIQVVPEWDDVGKDDTAAAARSALHCQGVRYVVVSKQEVGEATRQRIREVEEHLFQGIAPIYEDAELRAYEVVNERLGEPYWTSDPDEWYDAEALPVRNITGRWTIGEHGSLLIYPCVRGAESAADEALVTFDLFSFGQTRTVEMSLNGEPIGSVVVPLGVVRHIRLAVPLQAGENRLTLRSIEPAASPAVGATPGDERLVSLNISQVSISGNRR